LSGLEAPADQASTPAADNGLEVFGGAELSAMPQRVGAPAAEPVTKLDRVLAQRIKRANEAFRAHRYAQAANEYRRLLRNYPTYREAPVWRERLLSAEAALR
jgi:hypothetical protein